MAAGILELDKLLVGLTDIYGRAWHNHPNCTHLDGVVPYEEAVVVFDYEVNKVPLFLENGTQVVGANALVRTDTGTVLWPSVGERYVEIQNSAVLQWIKESIIDQFEISIESVGTLLNGQKAFVNLILNEHTVKGDISPTVTRLMYSNSFGGDSIQACVHGTRIVCQNTLRMASVQGAANNTLKKFRHTANASDRVEKHMVDLAEIVGEIKEHHEQLDYLATLPMKPIDVEKVLKVVFPVPEKDGRGKTLAVNKRESILNLFENKDDLQGDIAKTRYSFLSAVIDWADHQSTVRNGDDEVGRFWDGVWGLKDDVKQKTFNALLAA
jgi:phage/plasmid-like protein (TIGR03299 family)